MLPPPGLIGTTILGAGSEYVAYLIIMLSGPVALGTIIINHKDIYSIQCIPNCTDCGNSSLLKPSSADYIENKCIGWIVMHHDLMLSILLIGVIFSIFLMILLLDTIMVPRACIEQVFKEFRSIDSDSASRIVSVMEILTRDEIQVDENTDKKVVSIVHHIYGRAKAGYGFLMIKSVLIIIYISLSVISLVMLVIDGVKQDQPYVEDFHQKCVLPDLDGSRMITFVCDRNGSLDKFLEITQTTLKYLIAIYMIIQLIQCAYSFRYVRVIGCCASTRQKADYWAVEEARWLFKTRFGYDYKPEQAPRAVHENVEINAGE